MATETLADPKMISRNAIYLALLVVALTNCANVAVAQTSQRFALLIGNQAYSKAVGPLKNPRNDVKLVGASLRKLGFRTTVLIDANYRQMDVAIKRHLAAVRRAGADAIGFLYYSGHGVAQPETRINYILPVDIARADEDLWFNSFEQQSIIDRMKRQAPKATHFIVFDACRNELNLVGGAAKSIGTNKGFVPIENTTGILIAYATAPGKTASDVGRDGGPYARVLAEELLRPGVEAVGVFRRVQLKVSSAISQEPWLNYGSLREVYLAGRRSPDAVRWDALRSSKDTAEFEQFLKRFPASEFAQLARLKLDILKERQVNAAATRQWKQLASSNDIKALQQHVQAYPKHASAVLARNRITRQRALKRRDEARLAWEAVQASNDIAKLKNFKAIFPESPFANLANDKITKLLTPSKPPAGQSTRGDSSALGTKKQPAETISRPSSSEAYKLTRAIGNCTAYGSFLREYPTGFFADLANAWKEKNCTPKQVEVALAPPASTSIAPKIDAKQLARDLQSQLKRVQCYKGKVDGVWGNGSRRSLQEFSRFAKVKLQELAPTQETLNIVTGKKNVVCPVVAATPPRQTVTRKPASKKAKQKTSKSRSTKKNCMSYSQCVAQCSGSHCSSVCSGAYRSRFNVCK